MHPAESLTFEKVERKLRIAAALFKLAYQVKRFQIAQKHPELTPIQVNHKAYALIEKGCR
ncbi:MAG: hypothetical protein ACK5P5_08060 [Pseudobdellovibrionaceae bacterium]|jgi:hypothetical protein